MNNFLKILHILSQKKVSHYDFVITSSKLEIKISSLLLNLQLMKQITHNN